MPSKSDKERASYRANQICRLLSDELMSLASAYDAANKAYHQLWAQTYGDELKRIKTDD
jgi:hypothetical protein